MPVKKLSTLAYLAAQKAGKLNPEEEDARITQAVGKAQNDLIDRKNQAIEQLNATPERFLMTLVKAQTSNQNNRLQIFNDREKELHQLLSQYFLSGNEDVAEDLGNVVAPQMSGVDNFLVMSFYFAIKKNDMTLADNINAVFKRAFPERNIVDEQISVATLLNKNDVGNERKCLPLLIAAKYNHPEAFQHFIEQYELDEDKVKESFAIIRHVGIGNEAIEEQMQSVEEQFGMPAPANNI